MSFFNDFLDYFKVKDLTNKVSLSMIVGVGLIVVGKIKILNFSEELIEIKADKQKIILSGEELSISTMSKGEIIVAGIVKKIDIGELWRDMLE